jgi:hypothetical protein
LFSDESAEETIVVDLKCHRDRRRALPALDLRQIALGQSGLLGKQGQREAALLADRAQQPRHGVFSASRRSVMSLEPPDNDMTQGFQYLSDVSYRAFNLLNVSAETACRVAKLS